MRAVAMEAVPSSFRRFGALDIGASLVRGISERRTTRPPIDTSSRLFSPSFGREVDERRGFRAWRRHGPSAMQYLRPQSARTMFGVRREMTKSREMTKRGELR